LSKLWTIIWRSRPAWGTIWSRFWRGDWGGAWAALRPYVY
jgi:hypothetical protein